MLVVCPRIYGHAFFNSKDIPFMTFMIMSAYSGLRFLKAPSVIRAFVHAFFCALAVDTRIAGVLMPGITLMMYGAQTIVLSQNRSWKSFFAIVCYVLFSFLLIVLMWPMLWQNPVEKFIQFFQSAAHYQHPFYEFYMGQWLKPIDHELPWHYLPVWMMVTIPIIVLVLFFLGISSFLISLKRGLSAITQQPVMVMSLLWFFIPLTIVTITKPTIYDGWRHFYFVYPAMVMIAIYALSCLYAHKRIFVAVLFLLIINLSFTLTKMVGLHPYEHVYFNQLAGKDLQSSLKDFELDLWGVEYRKPIEYILNNDLGKDISLYSPNVFAPLNLLLIPAQQERGVHFVHDPHLAKYWILDYYAMKSRQNELELSRKLFMLSIDGVDVIGVYERSRF
jgi:hypothetical protein